MERIQSPQKYDVMNNGTKSVPKKSMKISFCSKKKAAKKKETQKKRVRFWTQFFFVDNNDDDDDDDEGARPFSEPKHAHRAHARDDMAKSERDWF